MICMVEIASVSVQGVQSLLCWRGVSGALDLECVAAFIARVADVEMEMLRVRYQFGQALRVASANGGGKALAEACGALRTAGLRLDVSAMRRIRQVAAVIRPDEFQELLMLRTRGGLVLKWSHFELLSRVRSKPRRTELAYWILDGDLRLRSAASKARGRGRGDEARLIDVAQPAKG